MARKPTILDVCASVLEQKRQPMTAEELYEEILRMTQSDLARRMRSTQPRVARLEQAEASLEMLIRALFALGATRREIGRLLAA
jgi:transcriptional regulator with XRE-family HTH domain